jgi:hypothetical protein
MSDKTYGVTDWTTINQYEERHNHFASSLGAMQNDIESHIITSETERGKSVISYLKHHQHELDEACCRFIFN